MSLHTFQVNYQITLRLLAKKRLKMSFLGFLKKCRFVLKKKKKKILLLLFLWQINYKFLLQANHTVLFTYINNSQTIDDNKDLFFAVLPNAVTGEMETPGINSQPGSSGMNVTPAGSVTAGSITTPAATDKTVTQTDQDKEKASRKRRHSASSSRSTSSKSSRKSSKSDSRESKSKSVKEDAKSTTSDSTQDRQNNITNKTPDAFLEVQAEMLRMLRQLAR